MKTAVVKMKSLTPYSQSAPFQTPKLEKEKPDPYDERC